MTASSPTTTHLGPVLDRRRRPARRALVALLADLAAQTGRCLVLTSHGWDVQPPLDPNPSTTDPEGPA